MKALGKLLGIVLALVVYGTLGAFMFVYVENRGTVKASGFTFVSNETGLIFRQLAENYSCLRNFSDDDMNRLALSLVDLKYSNQRKKMWTFDDGLQLVIETLTTIGESVIVFALSAQAGIVLWHMASECTCRIRISSHKLYILAKKLLTRVILSVSFLNEWLT